MGPTERPLTNSSSNCKGARTATTLAKVDRQAGAIPGVSAWDGTRLAVLWSAKQLMGRKSCAAQFGWQQLAAVQQTNIPPHQKRSCLPVPACASPLPPRHLRATQLPAAAPLLQSCWRAICLPRPGTRRQAPRRCCWQRRACYPEARAAAAAAARASASSESPAGVGARWSVRN